MHTAPIYRVAVDAKEQFIVTGSHDKTIKLCELKTGRLVRTIKPPIGEGNEGKVFSVAISPDRAHIVAGGWTVREWDNSYSIYIFDTSTGRLISRIEGLPNVIFHLTYSPDGRYLVACLGGKNGIRVYSTNPSGTYSPAFEDSTYGDSTSWASFDGSGNLVVSSDDSYIRLYDMSFRLIYKRKAAGGTRPFGVSFSPDGRRLAVGFADTTNIDIYSAKDLSFIESLNKNDIDKGNFCYVSFCPDGMYIFAEGRAQKPVNNNWKAIIRKWDTTKRDASADISVSEHHHGDNPT